MSYVCYGMVPFIELYDYEVKTMAFNAIILTVLSRFFSMTDNLFM